MEGVPVFHTVAEAVSERRANTSMIFVPAPFAADAIYEAVDAGIETVICITEGVPAHDMLQIHTYVHDRGVTLIGPNCPGALSPGKANVGIIPAEIFTAGNIGLVSRSGTLTYQIGHELTQMGLGNSTIVGIGGDPVVGSSFVDILTKFQADPETAFVVMVGEIGGDEEEKAAAFIEAELTKPVVAYIAGFTAPPGKTMGHAGAIISGSAGHGRGEEDGARGEGDSRRHDTDGDGRARCRPRAPLTPCGSTVGTFQRMPLGLGIWEIVILVGVLVLLFGSKGAPQMARRLGKGVKEIKDSVSEMDPRSLLDPDESPERTPPRELEATKAVPVAPTEHVVREPAPAESAPVPEESLRADEADGEPEQR